MTEHHEQPRDTIRRLTNQLDEARTARNKASAAAVTATTTARRAYQIAIDGLDQARDPLCTLWDVRDELAELAEVAQ